MGARRPDRPPLDRWTPDFSQLRSESFPTDVLTTLPSDLHRRRRAVRHPGRLRPAGTRPRDPRDRPAASASRGGDHPQPHRDVGGGLADARRRRDAHPFDGARAEMRCRGRWSSRAGRWRATRRGRPTSTPPASSSSDLVKRKKTSSSGVGLIRPATASLRRSAACRRIPSRSCSAASDHRLYTGGSGDSASQADQRAARRAGSQVLQRVAADDAGRRGEQPRIGQLAAFRDRVEHERGEQRAPAAAAAGRARGSRR